MDRATVARAALVVVGVLTLAWPVLAGDEEDRVKEAESYLSRMRLGSTSEIDEAIRDGDRVKDQADKLRSLSPKNEPGKTMASSYPDWVNKFQESARYLKQMKEAQLKADNVRLTERCADADRGLRTLISGYVDKKDPKGIAAITSEAENVGRIYGEELKKMEETHREMERWKGYARNFSETHGKWSDVKSRLHDSANDTWDRWNRRMEESRYKCQGVAKRKDNPLVA